MAPVEIVLEEEEKKTLQPQQQVMKRSRREPSPGPFVFSRDEYAHSSISAICILSHDACCARTRNYETRE